MKLKEIIHKIRGLYSVQYTNIEKDTIINKLSCCDSLPETSGRYTLYIFQGDLSEFMNTVIPDNILFVSGETPPPVTGKNLIQVNAEQPDELFAYLEQCLEEDSLLNAVLQEVQTLLYRKNFIRPVLDLLHKHINNPVMFHDANHRVAAFSPRTPVDDPDWNAMISEGKYDPEVLGDFFYYGYNRFKNTSKCLLYRSPTSAYDWIIYAAKHQKSILGYLISFNYEKEISESDRNLLSAVASMIAFRIKKDLDNDLESQYFINRLMTSGIIDSGEIELLMNKQDIPHDKEFCILLGNKEKSSAVYNKKIMINLSGRIRIYPYQYRNQMILLLVNDSSKPFSSYENDLQLFAEQTNTKVAMSPVFTDINDFRKNYELAKRALFLGNHYAEEDHFYRYVDFKFPDFLYECCEKIDVASYYHPAVLILEEYDEKNQAELGKTLYCYLSSDRSLNLTSKKLNIHKNTVTYRIHQIRELTGIDFTKDNELFFVLLCYKLRDICFLLP